MAGHVFISYSRADRRYVDELVLFLGMADIPVWVDSDLDYGERWGSVICDQVDTCAVFMPVMTTEAENSKWVTREILRAESKDRTIIPLLLAGDPFFRLADMHHEDVMGGRMPSPELVARLRELTGAAVESTPDPLPADVTYELPAEATTPSLNTGEVPGTASNLRPVTFQGRESRAVNMLVSVAAGFLGLIVGSLPIIIGTYVWIAYVTGPVVAAWAFSRALEWRKRTGRGRRLVVSSHGISYGFGKRALTFAWHELSAAGIRRGSGCVWVAVKPGFRRALKRQEDRRYGDLELCRVAQLDTTDLQVREAMALFAPWDRKAMNATQSQHDAPR